MSGWQCECVCVGHNFTLHVHHVTKGLPRQPQAGGKASQAGLRIARANGRKQQPPVRRSAVRAISGHAFSLLVLKCELYLCYSFMAT